MNIVIPVVLVVSGFIVIVREKDFITAVLNTTALLVVFIRPEIDDILPKLLGYDITAIVENHLIKDEAKIEYNEYAKLNQVGISKDSYRTE